MVVQPVIGRHRPIARSMRPDVIDLQAFYGSRQGQLVRRLVGRQIRTLWPDLTGAARARRSATRCPFLGPLGRGGRAGLRGHAAGPGRACAGRRSAPNQVLLAAEDELPLADRSIDRVLMVHALEVGRAVAAAAARGLAGAGRRRPGADRGAQPARAVVPQREHAVRPWPAVQLGPAEGGAAQQPVRAAAHARARCSCRRAARACCCAPRWSGSAIGLRWAKRFAGVLLMAAEKQIYAAPVEPARQAPRAPAYAAGAAARWRRPSGSRAAACPSAGIRRPRGRRRARTAPAR